MSQPFTDRAIDALIAAALRPGFSVEPPTEDEIKTAIFQAEQTPDLPDDEAMFVRIQQRINQGILGLKRPSSPSPAALNDQLVAMNRKNEDDTFSDTTQTGLDEARKKALEEMIQELKSDKEDTTP